MISIKDMNAVIRRVITVSKHSPRQFYTGIVFRIGERIFDILPFFVAYFWLASQWQSLQQPVFDYQPSAMSLNTVVIVLIIVLAGQLVCSYLGQRMTFLGSYRLMEGYRGQIINHIHRIPIGQLQKQRVGELSEVITDDVKRLEGIFTHLIADIASTLIVTLSLAVILFFIDWQITLSILITFPPALLGLTKAKRFFVERGKRKQALFSETSGLLIEFVMGLRTLRLFNRTAYWLELLRQKFTEIKQRSLGVEAWGGGAVMFYRLLLEPGLVGLLLAIGSLYQSGGGSSMIWLLYFLIIYKLYQPLLEIGETAAILNYAAESEKRLQQILDTPLLPEPEHPALPENFTISFDNVSFGYDERQVINDVSFSVPQGTLTAIVGPSGSGKSTLLNLLARFYDPQKGQIRIGNVDIKAMGSDLLYQYISIVFQNVQLNQGTIAENVAMGKPDASRTEIEKACYDAFCTDFIEQLPAGYETQIGESGLNLSGGERQRLSIARALLKNAPILLLDEATASVDPIAQHEIQSALSLLAKDRTVVMIAHRLNTIRYADQIIVLDRGRICGKGKHDELLQTNALYQQLWHAQNASL